MCEVEGDIAQSSFKESLIAAGHLIPLGVRGVFGRSGVFEGVVEGFERLVTRAGAAPDVDVVRMPPIFARKHYEKINHIHNFPDLLGSVHAFTGDSKAHRRMSTKFLDGDDWSEDLAPAATMLIPAACYPLYPTCTGTLEEGGRTVDLRSFVFRHEPSDEPTRMQMFRQREYVRLGTPEQAEAHRDHWLETGKDLLRGLGLPVEPVLANDPFFGRGGRLAKATQREQALKFELEVPINDGLGPTAIASSNMHLDYFGLAFDIKLPDGSPAHTSCVGFGLERVALALFKHHGLDPRRWPDTVREQLGLVAEA